MVGTMAAFARGPFAEVPLSAARIRLPPRGEGFGGRARKSKTPPAAILAARGEDSSRYHPVFARGRLTAGALPTAAAALLTA